MARPNFFRGHIKRDSFYYRIYIAVIHVHKQILRFMAWHPCARTGERQVWPFHSISNYDISQSFDSCLVRFELKIMVLWIKYINFSFFLDFELMTGCNFLLINKNNDLNWPPTATFFSKFTWQKQFIKSKPRELINRSRTSCTISGSIARDTIPRGTPYDEKNACLVSPVKRDWNEKRVTRQPE